MVLVLENLPAKAGDMREMGSALDWEDPWRRAIHSSILAWESHGQRSLEGYSP